MSFSPRWLAYEHHVDNSDVSHEGGDESTAVVLVDLARHRHRTLMTRGTSWWADNEGNGGDDTFGTPFAKWALNRNGDVAWLETNAVRILRQGAKRPRTMETRKGAVYDKLTLDGRHVRWTRDGVAVSALI